MRFILRIITFLTIFALLISSCRFDPNIDPLVILDPTLKALGTVQPGGNPDDLLRAVPDGEETGLTSEEAMALCISGMYGDSDIGSCIAPGGETYYAWSSPDRVIEVDITNPWIVEFRTAALNRSAAWEAFVKTAEAEKKAIWTLGVELLLLASCPAGAFSASFGAVPVGVGLLMVCGADILFMAFGADDIANDAEKIVVKLNDFYQRGIEADYAWCRMEGKSDEQCR
jgi:hypothetical protein